MVVLLAALGLCAAVWLLVAVHRGWLSARWMHCPTLLAAVVILLGSVFGRDFASLNLGPLPLTLDRLLWSWMMVHFVALVLLRRIKPLPISSADVLVAGLMILLTLSTFSHDFRYRDNLPLTRLLFFNLMPFGIYFVARHSPIDGRQLRWILYGSVAFSVYLSATGIAEWRNWPHVIFPSYITNSPIVEFLGRARGPFLNPVVCGIFQTVGAVAGLSLWPRAGLRGRILLGVLLPLFLVGLFATFTRSIWISAAVSLAVTTWLMTNQRQRGAMIILAAVSSGLFVVFFLDDVTAFKRDKNVSKTDMAESAQLRPLLAQVALNMFVDRPVFGHGFGQYTRAKRLYHQDLTDQPLKKVMPYMQHNVVLSYLTETGLVGVTLLVGIFGVFSRSVLRMLGRRASDPAHRSVAIIAMATLMSYLINGMFHDVSIMPMTGSLFYFMLGLASHVEASQIRLGSTAADFGPANVAAAVPHRAAS